MSEHRHVKLINRMTEAALAGDKKVLAEYRGVRRSPSTRGRTPSPTCRLPFEKLPWRSMISRCFPWSQPG